MAGFTSDRVAAEASDGLKVIALPGLDLFLLAMGVT